MELGSEAGSEQWLTQFEVSPPTSHREEREELSSRGSGVSILQVKEGPFQSYQGPFQLLNGDSKILWTMLPGARAWPGWRRGIMGSRVTQGRMKSPSFILSGC